MNIKTLENVLRPLVLAGIFVVPFIVLYVANSLFFPYITGKALVFRLVVEVIFFAWLVLAATNKEYRPRRSALLYAVVGTFGFMAVAALVGEEPARSFWSNFERMEGVVTHLHLLAYFIVLVSVLKTEKLWVWFLNTNVVASILVAGYGLMQLLGVYEIMQGSVRVDSTLGNAGYFGGYMMMVFFVTAYLLVKAWPDKLWRYVYIAVMVLQVFMVMQSETRGAILGLIGGIGLAIIVALVLVSRHQPAFRRWGAGALIALLAIAGAFWLSRDSALVQNTPELARIANISLEDNTVKARFMVWGMSLEGVKEQPILGWGPGNFQLVFNKYYDPGMYGQEPWFDRSHNVFLDWLVAGGLVGLGLYLLMFALAIFYLLKPGVAKNQGDVELAWERAVLLGLLAAYGFQNFFIFDNVISYSLFLAVLALIAFITIETSDDALVKKKKSASSVLPAHHILVAVLALVLLASSAYFAVIKPTFAASRLLQALQGAREGRFDDSLASFKQVFDYRSVGQVEALEQLMSVGSGLFRNQAVSDGLKQEFVSLVEVKMSEHLADNPTAVRQRIIYAQFLVGAGNLDLAVKELETARPFAPAKQSLLSQLATYYSLQGKAEQALATAKESFELEPANDEARKIYALMALLADQESLAVEILTPVYGGLAVPDDRFINFFAGSKRYDIVSEIWSKRAEVEPQNVEVWQKYALSRYAAGDRAGALATLELTIKNNPDFQTEGEKLMQAIRQGLVKVN
ncbi:MAG: hypothetical protein A2589_02195 [Candidatus Vogelbacteria bacterium RIFOXYD1_FULL_46_19]|uniref:O-antigen ligase-related domain-containing protein n=1 Tax=Candidatus Vogelbacteria bacterium RIFOXYD1_FULL_46_19 TaxID=1802439 RepID=A0A1G2QGF1_9BACT|nr:MAG: hypothetical protein A2589_02195 [Candidatus Vogelbacteria bacterium RIFOXYD1_FULL_46_19]